MKSLILLTGFLCVFCPQTVLSQESITKDINKCRLTSWVTAVQLGIVYESALNMLSPESKNTFKKIFSTGVLNMTKTSICKFTKEIQLIITEAASLRNNADGRIFRDKIKYEELMDQIKEIASGKEGQTSDLANKCVGNETNIQVRFEKFTEEITGGKLKEKFLTGPNPFTLDKVNKINDATVAMATELQLLLILCEEVGNTTRVFDLVKFSNQLRNVIDQELCRAKKEFLKNYMPGIIKNMFKGKNPIVGTILKRLETDYPFWSWEIQKHHDGHVHLAEEKSLMCGAFVSDQYKDYLITYNDKEYDFNDNNDELMNFNQRSRQIANSLVTNTLSMMKMIPSKSGMENHLNYNCLHANFGLRCDEFLGYFQNHLKQKTNEHTCFYAIQNFFPTLCPPLFHTTKSSITFGVEIYLCGLTLGVTAKSKNVRSCGERNAQIHIQKSRGNRIQKTQKYWKNTDLTESFVKISNKWMLFDKEGGIIKMFEQRNESDSREVATLYEPDENITLTLTAEIAYYSSQVETNMLYASGSWEDLAGFNLPSSSRRANASLLNEKLGYCQVNEAEWITSYSLRDRKFVKLPNSAEWREIRKGKNYGGPFALKQFVSDRHVILTRDNKTVTLNHSFFDDSANYSDWSFKLGYWSKWSLKFYNEKPAEDSSAENARLHIDCKRVKRFEWHDTSNTIKYLRSLRTKTWMRITTDKGITNEYYEYEADWESETFTLLDRKADKFVKLSRKVAREGDKYNEQNVKEHGRWVPAIELVPYYRAS